MKYEVIRLIGLMYSGVETAEEFYASLTFTDPQEALLSASNNFPQQQ